MTGTSMALILTNKFSLFPSFPSHPLSCLLRARMISHYKSPQSTIVMKRILTDLRQFSIIPEGCNEGKDRCDIKVVKASDKESFPNPNFPHQLHITLLEGDRVAATSNYMLSEWASPVLLGGGCFPYPIVSPPSLIISNATTSSWA